MTLCITNDQRLMKIEQMCLFLFPKRMLHWWIVYKIYTFKMCTNELKSNVQIVSVAGTRFLYENLSIFLFYMWLNVFIKDFKDDLYKICQLVLIGNWKRKLHIFNDKIVRPFCTLIILFYYWNLQLITCIIYM